MWGREFAGTHGVALPLQALAHYYVVTDKIPDLPANLPTIKSSDDFSYVKDEAGSLMVGFFEPGSYAWSSRGIPEDAEFATLPEDWDHLGPFYERMIQRVPVLADTGIRLFFSGPESFTPDGFYHLGEVPDVEELLRRLRIQLDRLPERTGRRRRSSPTGSSTGTHPWTSPRPTLDE